MEKGTQTLVHGDDYFSAGSREDLNWHQSVLEKKYELEAQRIGGSSGTAREGEILNRIVRFTGNGYEYEADPRPAEK